MDIKSIAELLPDGLTEETVDNICNLIDSVIKEEVQNKYNILTAKVNAFLRTKIDSIKEHALSELAEENPLYRNAVLFEEVKSMLSLEIADKQKDNAVAKVEEQVKTVEEENALLLEQLEAAAAQIADLQSKVKEKSNKVKVYKTKLEEMANINIKLLEEKKELIAESDLEFKGSDVAVIQAREMKSTVKEGTKVSNQFLTEGVMALMPNLNESN